MVSERRDQNFFTDFFTARTAFREMVDRTNGAMDVLPLDAKGPRGEPLGIDVAWFGSKAPRRAVLHSSGLHGVEGFAGSAIQIQMLRHFPDVSDDAALILVHNHPSGDPKPSREDIEMTKEIRKAAEALGITIHDHLVIGRKGHASFRSLGLL